MTIVLIGGGWIDPEPVYQPFLDAARAHAGASVLPRIACVVVDEGDGAEQAERWQSVLRSLGPCDAQAVLVPLGATLDADRLTGADGVLVCGGLTPAYADALAPVAEAVRALVAGGVPYAGFSAGSAVAARHALVGGYRWQGRPVCPEDAGEDLEEITVVDGLGLIEVALDVHAAQWGTLGRLVAAVGAGLVPRGIAVDEDTAVVIDDAGAAQVVGAGAVHDVRADGAGAVVRDLTAGATVDGLVVPGR